jgi:hypothetical protein
MGHSRRFDSRTMTSGQPQLTDILSSSACLVSGGDMKARDFIARPVKLFYDPRWREARTQGQICNRGNH